MDVCCAAGAPVSIDYSPTGSVQELGGVPCYVTGESQDAALIGIYDIFGFSPQVSIDTCVFTPRPIGCCSLPP